MKKHNALICSVSVVAILTLLVSCGQCALNPYEVSDDTIASQSPSCSASDKHTFEENFTLYEDESIEYTVEYTEPIDYPHMILDELGLQLQTAAECCGYSDPRNIRIAYCEDSEATHAMLFLDTVFGRYRTGDGGFNLDIAEYFFLHDFAYSPCFAWLWPFSYMMMRPAENNVLTFNGFSYVSPDNPPLYALVDLLLLRDRIPRTAYHIRNDDYGISFKVGNLYVTIEKGEIVGTVENWQRHWVSVQPLYEPTSVNVYETNLCISCVEIARRARIANRTLDTLDNIGGRFSRDKINYLLNPHYKYIPSFAWVSDLPPNHIISSIGWKEFSYSVCTTQTDFDTIMDKFVKLMENHGFERLIGVISARLLDLYSYPLDLYSNGKPDGTEIVFVGRHTWYSIVSLEKGEKIDGVLNVYVRAMQSSRDQIERAMELSRE